ncbi:hypothetical protein LOZ66_002086 [Ophidiomyces ophidiicola]|nr:hypothetical protein LOZ66_002086 [Ophidiomyces ophidiicola]
MAPVLPRCDGRDMSSNGFSIFLDEGNIRIAQEPISDSLRLCDTHRALIFVEAGGVQYFPLTMPLSIRRLSSPADLSRAVDIQSTTFANSAFCRTVGASPEGNPRSLSPSERHAIQISRLQDALSSDPTFHLLGAVDDETGEILAVAKWYVFKGDDSLEKWKNGVRSDEAMEIPKGVDEGGYRFAKGKLFDAKRAWFGENGREHCFLGVLCTLPAHQGRGAGTLLLKYGLDIADEHGLESYLESSTKGRPLYERHGFKDITLPNGRPGLLEFDLGHFTGRGGDQGDWVRLALMARKPKQKTEC